MSKVKVPPEQIRRLLRARIQSYGRDEVAEAIGINTEYLMQQVCGSRDIGMRVLRYLKIDRVTTVSYYMVKK